MDKKRFVTEKYNQAEKTTHVVHGNTVIHSVKLTSGDVIVEHCICMDPNDFDIEKGLSLCKEKVIKRLMKMHEPVSSMATGGLIPTSATGGHISAPAIRGDIGREVITINMSRSHSTSDLIRELNNEISRHSRQKGVVI